MRADAKIEYNDRGVYDATKAYHPNDQVESATGIFIAQMAVSNNAPEVNTPGTETAGTGVVSNSTFPYVDLAQRFTPTVGMKISGFRYYAQLAGDHLAGKVGIAADITTATAEPTWLTNGVVSIEANTRTIGWNTVTFPAEITLTANTTYVVAWYGTGKNVGYSGSSATAGLFMTLGSTFYNSSQTASGPSYQNQSDGLREYFDWTFVGSTLPWRKVGDIPGIVERANVALGTNAASQTDYTWYEIRDVCRRGLLSRLTVAPDGATPAGLYDLELRSGVGATPGEKFHAATDVSGVYDISAPVYVQGNSDSVLWLGIKNKDTSAGTYTLRALRVEKFA